MAESEGQGGKTAATEDKKPDDSGPDDRKPDDRKTAPAIAVIELFGGIRPMAKDLGVAVSTVQGWKERESIPANRHDQIRAAAQKKGLALDAALLRASALPEAGSTTPPVIEAEAQEVKAADSPAKDASAAEKSSAGKMEKPAQSAASSVASRSSRASRASAAPEGSSKPEGVEKAEPSAKPEPAGSAAPPPRRSGSLVPGVVLGVLLAVAIAVAMVFSRGYWLPLVDPQSGQQQEAVASALQDLDVRLADLQAALPPDNSEAVAAVNDRLSTLEAAVSQGAGQDPETRAALESLSANLARLTDRLQSLEESQAAAGIPTEALSNRLSSEAARLDELLTAQSELVARLEQAERDLATAAASRDAAPGSQETLLLLAMLQLRDAIRGSGPYEEPLRMLQNLAEGDAALTDITAPLERRAPAGLPSLRDLQAAFPEVARRLAAIELGEEGEGWSAGVLRRLSEAVNLRPVGLVEGDSPTAVAARAEVKLNDGDLEGALAEISSLTGAAAEAAAQWRGEAEARVAANQAVSALGAMVSERFRLTAGG
ncbi:carph-isopro domain-containing protein [Pelagibius sp.]|uniref:carph-isopro domain-containing protein n=1 Tax=Pelagibius sp. TaxID=1931238 RepID=UPI003B50D3B0